MVENLTVPEYTTDRAVRNSVRAAARTLGLSPRAILALPRAELRRVVKRARGRAEREWHKASLRLDAVIALQDLLEEVHR
jgi:hypothetical protein